MKKYFLILAFITCILMQAKTQDTTKQLKQNTSAMARIERTEKKYEELFGQKIAASKTDPELMTILQRFIFGEVFYTGNLDDRTSGAMLLTY